MKKILVTGANGQLGQCLQKISSQFEEFEFIFTDSETLDITNKEEVNDFFGKMLLIFVLMLRLTLR